MFSWVVEHKVVYVQNAEAHAFTSTYLKKKSKVISINKKYGDEQMWKNDR